MWPRLKHPICVIMRLCALLGALEKEYMWQTSDRKDKWYTLHKGKQKTTNPLSWIIWPILFILLNLCRLSGLWFRGPRRGLCARKTGLSPPIIYHWPFQGGASLVVYSYCHCSSAFCLSLSFCSSYLASSWLSACVGFPFGVWGRMWNSIVSFHLLWTITAYFMPRLPEGSKND